MSVGVAVLQGFAEKKLHLGPTSDPSHQVNYENTVEPPVSDHPKCKDFVVVYDRITTGGLLQYICAELCSSLWSLKFFVHS